MFNFKIALACFKFIVCLSNIKRFESWSQSPKQFSSMLKISPRSQKSQEYIWRTKFPDHQLSCSTCNRDKMSPCKKNPTVEYLHFIWYYLVLFPNLKITKRFIRLNSFPISLPEWMVFELLKIANRMIIVRTVLISKSQYFLWVPLNVNVFSTCGFLLVSAIGD